MKMSLEKIDRLRRDNSDSVLLAEDLVKEEVEDRTLDLVKRVSEAVASNGDFVFKFHVAFEDLKRRAEDFRAAVARLP